MMEALSKKERMAIKKFVRSPFFNHREDVVNLCNYLMECLFVHNVIPTKEQAYKKVYVGKEERNVND